MNWYKRSNRDVYDWDDVKNRLKRKWKREPSNEEIEEEGLRRVFDDSGKTKPFHTHL
jgi:hypothetical protein